MPVTLDERVDARPLALTRMLVGAGAVVIALEMRVILGRVADGAVSVPYLPLTYSTSLPVLNLWLILTLLACVLLTLGLFTRPAAAVTSLAFVVALLWDQQTYSNHLTLLVLLSGLLALGDPGGAWALDARRLGRRPTPFWVQLLVMTQISTVYLFAGVSKLNERYLSGSVLEDTMSFSLPPATLPWLAAASVLTEVGLAIALWLRRTRVPAAVVGVLLHVSITVSVGDPLVLGAFALLTLSAYPLFLTRPPLLPRGLGRTSTSPTLA